MAAALSALTLASCGGSAGTSPEMSIPISTTGASSGYEGMTAQSIQPLTFTNGASSVSFDGASDYLMVVGSTDEGGDAFTLQMDRGGAAALVADGDSARPASLEVADEDPVSQFHQSLRKMEETLQDSGVPMGAGDSGAQAGLTVGGEAPAALSIGDTQDFHVISSIGSLSSYANVTGELRLATSDLYVYVDQNVAGNISDADVSTLAHNFEDIALPRERKIMGMESDINGDGHISILMTCVVNQMAGTGGIVTGFFFPGDLYPRSNINPSSNAQEIFYTLVPDPEGKCGTPITSSFAVNNILPGVLAHEYQHMNSFNQHVFKNKSTTEEPWLNECLSHLWEDLSGYGNENPSRVNLFFAQPSKTPLIPAGLPTLAERGACYTFLRYLYEQSSDGDAFLTRLYATAHTGVANLEGAFQGSDPDFDQFPEFVNRWSTALSLSETGLTSDPRYNYQARAVDPQTGNKTGICIRCDVQDGRGTVLDGPVMSSLSSFPSATATEGTASQFYRLTAPSGTVQVSGSPTSSLVGSLITLSKN